MSRILTVALAAFAVLASAALIRGATTSPPTCQPAQRIHNGTVQTATDGRC